MSRRQEDEAGLATMGTAIERLRQKRSLDQAALARRAGVSVRGLREVERGQVEAHWGTLRRIAKGLDIALEDLMKAAEETPERDSNF